MAIRSWLRSLTPDFLRSPEVTRVDPHNMRGDATITMRNGTVVNTKVLGPEHEGAGGVRTVHTVYPPNGNIVTRYHNGPREYGTNVYQMIEVERYGVIKEEPQAVLQVIRESAVNTVSRLLM